MDTEDQRRAFELIERTIWFRPRTRARRLTEAIRDFADDNTTPKDRWFGTVLSLPALLPAVTAARTIEGIHRMKIRTRYRRALHVLEERLALIDDVRDRISRPDSPYRDSALTKALATLPHDLSALFTDGTKALVIRYTIHPPVEEWPDDRGVEGICQLVIDEGQELAPLNLWREQGSREIEDMAEKIREVSDRCLTCKLSYQRWTWNHGSLHSLAVRRW
jgi:hypothetical protein